MFGRLFPAVLASAYKDSLEESKRSSESSIVPINSTFIRNPQQGCSYQLRYGRLREAVNITFDGDRKVDCLDVSTAVSIRFNPLTVLSSEESNVVVFRNEDLPPAFTQELSPILMYINHSEPLIYNVTNITINTTDADYDCEEISVPLPMNHQLDVKYQQQSDIHSVLPVNECDIPNYS